MKATPATSMLVLMLSLVSHPVFADEGIKDLVSDETLAAYCATVPLDSETTATLTALDGSTVTGIVECEEDDLVVVGANDDDQQGTDEQGNLENDDSDDDHEGDDDSGDDSNDGGDDSGGDDSGGDDGHDEGGDD